MGDGPAPAARVLSAVHLATLALLTLFLVLLGVPKVTPFHIYPLLITLPLYAFWGGGTILADDQYLAGNFRLHFPAAGAPRYIEAMVPHSDTAIAAKRVIRIGYLMPTAAPGRCR